ncbi:dephospho-CoA kinase [Psychromicrobium xiongbiense]|uniref:dephospho-CoA kinase n=1 Tax=Psychromicrobium xiongbiense TaxID=3051184 RepID=UPI00255461A8|nr:dephospho-CoA kinase [Psychromicrobium sp. YIM S02556]
MLSIGLTGGIAAGKSVVAATLQSMGAVMIDADRLAREVVEPGTEGLVRLAEAFGTGVLSPDGSLHRARLAGLVFGDEAQRQKLNGVVHPLVRERSTALREAAPSDAVVVEDIPLLIETGQVQRFHLVLVVDAPENLRAERLLRDRGMSADQAWARIRAQASDEERRAVADVLLENTGTADELILQATALWKQRLLPFAGHLSRHEQAPRTGPARIVPADPQWPATAERLRQRILAVTGTDGVAVDHIGSTAVPALAAKDVIDLQLRVQSWQQADALDDALAGIGLPRVPGEWADTPKVSDPDPAHWQKRLHANSDPGRAVNLHVRIDGSTGAQYALAFRDWLRSDERARRDYEALKVRLATEHAADQSAGGYAQAKEPWFTEVADPALETWKARSGWMPPRA